MAFQNASVFNRAVVSNGLPHSHGLLRAKLQPVEFKPGQTVQDAGHPIEHCFFLETGLVSLSWPAGSGKVVEVGMAGARGFVGIAAVLGAPRSAHTVRARSKVRAWRVGSDDLRAAIGDAGGLRHALTNYVSATLDQSHEIAACNAQHSIEQRLARWIFVASHHVGGEPLHLTHDALSALLNVRRASVTTALHKLEGEHAIHASRGLLAVRDRDALRRCSCGCHRVVELGPGQPIGNGLTARDPRPEGRSTPPRTAGPEFQPPWLRATASSRLQ